MTVSSGHSENNSDTVKLDFIEKNCHNHRMVCLMLELSASERRQTVKKLVFCHFFGKPLRNGEYNAKYNEEKNSKKMAQHLCMACYAGSCQQLYRVWFYGQGR